MCQIRGASHISTHHIAPRIKVHLSCPVRTQATAWCRAPQASLIKDHDMQVAPRLLVQMRPVLQVLHGMEPLAHALLHPTESLVHLECVWVVLEPRPRRIARHPAPCCERTQPSKPTSRIHCMPDPGRQTSVVFAVEKHKVRLECRARKDFDSSALRCSE